MTAANRVSQLSEEEFVMIWNRSATLDEVLEKVTASVGASSRVGGAGASSVVAEKGGGTHAVGDSSGQTLSPPPTRCGAGGDRPIEPEVPIREHPPSVA